ncbi:hypothetical protein D3C73_1311950 [compost metagenome]
MVLRQVQRFEVVVVCLHFRAFSYFVAHADEDILNLLNNPVQRMNPALRKTAARKRNIHFLRLQPV